MELMNVFENGKEIVQQLLLHGKLKAFNALSRSGDLLLIK